MAIVSVTPSPVNNAPPDSTERTTLDLVLGVALRHERLAGQRVREEELRRRRPPGWHHDLLVAERDLSVCHTAVIDAHLALCALVDAPAAAPLSDLEIDWAAEHGLLPSDELGGGW